MGIDGSDDSKSAVRPIPQLKFPASTQVTVWSIMRVHNTNSSSQMFESLKNKQLTKYSTSSQSN